MKIIDTIGEFLDSLESKDFYKYIGIGLSILLLLIFFLMYRFHSNVGYYKKQIRQLNEQRDEIRQLLEKASLIKKQKEEVNAILEADPDFKIRGYFEKLLAQLHLTDKNCELKTAKQERGEQDYTESILTSNCTGMNMKDLTELLNEIEQNNRIYTKELEIQKKSRKESSTIEVQLTIATLQPKTELAEFEE